MTTRETVPGTGRAYEDRSKLPADEPAGFVYRVPGPGGQGEMWLAESLNGHIAHGRTPKGAVDGLREGMEALAAGEGLSLTNWLAKQEVVHARVVDVRELLQT